MATRLEAPAPEPLSISGNALEARSVVRRFGQTTALDGLSLAVRRYEVLAVVGPSGCGKSTLLELLAGLQRPDAGEVVAGPCALMFQRDLLMPHRSAIGNAALALECRGVARAEARRQAAPLFERFGLAGFEGARPSELSGGMRQRVAFVRTLLAERETLLLDEPFGALDSITRAGMQEWLAQALADEPRTVVLVTHDVEEALYLADRVAVMSPRPGRIVSEIATRGARALPRREAVATPDFAATRQGALEALGC